MPFRAFLALTLILPAAHAQKRPASIAEALSSGFPTSLTPSPSGTKVAWVMNIKGVRNVWVAEAPGWQGRQITPYVHHDGLDMGELAWTHDSARIVLVRGGAPNSKGEIPNPASSSGGTAQSVRIVGADGQGLRSIAEGSGPAVARAYIAYISKGQIWGAGLAENDKPSQWAFTRGTASNLRWSPDGTALAFVSRRGDHSFIGVFKPGDKSLKYLDASVDNDGSPVWSPDSKRIAFQRIPSTAEVMTFIPKREALPWSIRVADVETGQGREVWRADRGRGSAYFAIESEDQIFWMAQDRIAFAWEKDGWNHLYSVPLATGAAKLLTPGEFEVESVSQSPDRRELIYSSNQDDIERRHIWRVAGDGASPPRQVTKGKGIEWAAALAGSALASIASDAKRPAHIVIDGKEPIAETFPYEGLIEPKAVEFKAADGMTIRGQLFEPAGSTPRRRPAVIFFHGGSRRQMLLGWHNRGYYHNTYAINQFFASRGYVVLAVNYRSGTGYGMEFREALDYGAAGASEVRDVIGAGLYLRRHPEVDPDRVGLWGGSYGGYLTAMGMSKASELFAAGVDIHGVHDWNVVIKGFLPSYNPQAAPDRARLAYQSSPMAHLDGWKQPVLVIHGDDDRNVPFSETVALVEGLRKRNVKVEELIFPDEVHDFLANSHWVQVGQAALEFFDRRLRR